MSELREKYDSLLSRYNALSNDLAVLREKKSQAEKKNKKLKEEAKRVLKKDEIKDLDAVIQKLEKVTKEKLEKLTEEVREKEELVSKFMISESSQNNELDILEDV